MNQSLELLQKYQSNKLISIKEKDDLLLTCYTKKAFYSKEWDDITNGARGHVYDSNMNPVSVPFNKIFNLGEVPETIITVIQERIRSEAYTIWEKLNGHLSILFLHDGTFYNTTKGSWDHEFISKDRLILDQNVIPNLWKIPSFHKYTFMFEIIGEHDKHMMYEDYVYRYGKDQAVLLGAINNSTGKSVGTNGLIELGKILNVPVPIIYLPSLALSLDDMFLAEGIEGYVIHFHKDDYRVKIKTDEYTTERYKRTLVSNGKIKEIFREHYDSEFAFSLIDEEYHASYRVILDGYARFMDIELDKATVVFGLIYEENNGNRDDIIYAINNYKDFFIKSILWYLMNDVPMAERRYRNEYCRSTDFSLKIIDRGD